MQAFKTETSSQTQTYETENSQNTKHNISTKLDRESFVSWLFLVGSLLFVLDAILENIQGISFSSLLHFLASVLFTIGSVLFIPNHSQPD